MFGHQEIETVKCLKRGLCSESPKIIDHFSSAENSCQHLFEMLDRLPVEH